MMIRCCQFRPKRRFSDVTTATQARIGDITAKPDPRQNLNRISDIQNVEQHPEH